MRERCSIIENKLNILDTLAKGASEFNIGKSTVTDPKGVVVENSIVRLIIFLYIQKSVMMHLADDEKVDEAVCLWYVKELQGLF